MDGFDLNEQFGSRLWQVQERSFKFRNFLNKSWVMIICTSKVPTSASGECLRQQERVSASHCSEVRYALAQTAESLGKSLQLLSILLQGGD